jgi:hypothetical protein
MVRAPIPPGPDDRWITRIDHRGGYGKSAIWNWSVADAETKKTVKSGQVKGARNKAEAAIEKVLFDLG